MLIPKMLGQHQAIPEPFVADDLHPVSTYMYSMTGVPEGQFATTDI